jgi:hypothetical protein
MCAEVGYRRPWCTLARGSGAAGGFRRRAGGGAVLSDPPCTFELRSNWLDSRTNFCSNNWENGAWRIPAGHRQPGGAWGSAPSGHGRRTGRGGQAPLIGGAAVSRAATSTGVRAGGSQSEARPRCRVAPSALALLESARSGLAASEGEASAAARYVAAHLAALRAAAAVVAARAEPGTSSRRRRPLSVWELLPKVEPALAEWAAFFAAGAAKRAAAEAGLPRAVSLREADDLLRDAEMFVSLAENALGVPAQPLLPMLTAG